VTTSNSKTELPAAPDGSAEAWRELVDVLREGVGWWFVINVGAACGAFLVAVAAVAMLSGVKKQEQEVDGG
jgi:hypothetical protein